MMTIPLYIYIYLYDDNIYIYIYTFIQHWCIVFFQTHQKPKDWTLWGSRLGVEGRSIPVFLVAFLGMDLYV